MNRNWRDREELVEARGAEYKAGQMTEAQFRAYLFGMRLRGEDIRHKLHELAPPAPPKTFEEHRLDASREWIRRRRDAKARQG